VICNVDATRLRVLSLFVDIPGHHVTALVNKCEHFITALDLENNDELDSEDSAGRIDDSDVTQAGGPKRS